MDSCLHASSTGKENGFVIFEACNSSVRVIFVPGKQRQKHFYAANLPLVRDISTKLSFASSDHSNEAFRSTTVCTYTVRSTRCLCRRGEDGQGSSRLSCADCDSNHAAHAGCAWTGDFARSSTSRATRGRGDGAVLCAS